MMSMKTWSSISVYDFFRTYNWTGETVTLEPLNPVKKVQKSESLLSLSLGEFLLQSNWQGQKVKTLLNTSTKRTQKSLLTLSVADFFQEIVWQSRPEIAPMSNKSSVTSSIDTPSLNLDLNNLSDLF
ncbi:MAG: hypothetical protein WBM32_08075 [Crocosphaera sp.]